MGAVAWAMRHRSVSHPRSSNRTCGFPASGSPTGFTVRHTKQITDRKRHRDEASSVILRLTIQLSLKVRMIVGVCRLIANHLHLAFFESIPEVRVLPSTGITRLQRSYYPVQTPPMPPPEAPLRPLPSHQHGSPPITRTTFPTCRAHYPGGSSGCACRLLPPGKWQEGRHPHCHFRGLLRLHSRYGPPDRSAAHRRPLSRGSNPCGYPPSRSSATGSIDNSPGGNPSRTLACQLPPAADIRAHARFRSFGREGPGNFTPSLSQIRT